MLDAHMLLCPSVPIKAACGLALTACITDRLPSAVLRNGRVPAEGAASSPWWCVATTNMVMLWSEGWMSVLTAMLQRVTIWQSSVPSHVYMCDVHTPSPICKSYLRKQNINTKVPAVGRSSDAVYVPYL